MSSRVASSHNLTCAITGIGLAASLGRDAETVWARVRRGDAGFAPMTAMESPLPPCKDGGQAIDLPADYAAELPREARYLRWTIEAALADASLDRDRPYEPARCAIVLGTTLHGMRAAGTFLRTNDAGALRTFLAGDTLSLATRGLGLGGASMTTCSACSSSLGAIALGVTLLESGEADLVIAGGYDTISEYAWAGFNALRLVSDPPLRPFARGRVGMKVAEGYGIVTLERLPDATRRNVTPRAIVAGWGESADAFHLTRPHPAGEGAVAAMRQAMERAEIAPADLGLIAAHATGTPENDASEASAIGAVLGDAVVPVVGFKSHLGHTLGGAGAVELILSSLALRDGVLPPTANSATPDVEYPAVRLTTGAERPAAITHTLNTSLGFGGANTCVVLRSPDDPATAGRRSTLAPASLRGNDVCITGIGALVPGAIGNAAFAARCREGDRAQLTTQRTIDDAAIEPFVNARRIRRMSPYVKLSLCAATLACGDAGVLDRPAWLAGAAAILGTTHGSAGYSYEYYGQIVREGVAAANPMLFAEGVPNAAAAQLSLMLGLRGACQTIIGTRTAGLDAMRLAVARIQTGAIDRVIVCAGEEACDVVDAAYLACDAASEAGPSCSTAVAFVLESRASLAARNPDGDRLPYATVGRGATVSGVDDLQAALAAVRQAATPGRAGFRRARDGAPFALPGDAFSAAPLLGLAALLLTESDRPPLHDEVDAFAIDRTGIATLVPVTLEAGARRPTLAV